MARMQSLVQQVRLSTFAYSRRPEKNQTVRMLSRLRNDFAFGRRTSEPGGAIVLGSKSHHLFFYKTQIYFAVTGITTEKSPCALEMAQIRRAAALGVEFAMGSLRGSRTRHSEP
jgi:hypothetical protein